MGAPRLSRSAASGRRTAAIVGLTLLTAATGSVAGDFRSAWYLALHKPPWQPPGRVIGAVWSLLYTLIAVALAVLFRADGALRDRGLVALAGAQYLLNAAYTPLLTRARALGPATVDCALLAVIVGWLIRRAWPRSRPAALLLVPYALWTSFATLLSWRLRQLNRGA